MILRTKNLHKQFGGIHAMRDLNLAVAEHGVHAIIGPNGAGKTTLLAALAGALRADSGNIFFAGNNITRLSIHQRARLGLVRSYQITSVIAPMTLLENVMLAAQATDGHSYHFWSPVSEDKKLRDNDMQHLAEVGLEARANIIAGTAAHGEQRRLELAMALALQPRLLLLDEPMAGMSKEESVNMIALLDELKSRTTIAINRTRYGRGFHARRHHFGISRRTHHRHR